MIATQPIVPSGGSRQGDRNGTRLRELAIDACGALGGPTDAWKG